MKSESDLKILMWDVNSIDYDFFNKSTLCNQRRSI